MPHPDPGVRARRSGSRDAGRSRYRGVRRSPLWLAAAGFLAASCGGSSDRAVEEIFEARHADGAERIELARKALHDEDPRVRALAAWSLGQSTEVAATGALADLVPLLEDRSANVRAAALGALHAAPCLVDDGELAHLFHDVEPIVRLEAVGLFAECAQRPSAGSGDSAQRLSPLLGALDDEDADVREAVVLAIGTERQRECAEPPGGRLPVKRAVEVDTGLLAPAGENPAAAAAPEAQDNSGCGTAAEDVQRAREIVSRLGAIALGDLDVRVRAAAAGALAGEAPDEADSFLRFVLLDAQPVVRLAAQGALERRARAATSARFAREALQKAARAVRATPAGPPVPVEPDEKRKPAEDDPLPAAGKGGTGRSSSR